MENFEISLTKISEKEFFLAPNEDLKISHKNLQLGFNFNFKWKEDSDLIEVLTTIIYLYKTTKTEKEILRFKCVLEFLVKDLNKVLIVDKETAKVKVPNSLEILFISTSISTSRGMLFYKTAGTYLSNFHLPLLVADDFVKINND